MAEPAATTRKMFGGFPRRFSPASGKGSPFRAVLKNFGTVMSGQAAITGMGFAALTLNTRALELSALGILFLVQATCELTSKLLAFQNWQTMIKFGAHAMEEGDAGTLRAVWRFGFLLDLLAATAAAVIAGGLFLFVPGLIGLDADEGLVGLVYAASLLLSGSGTSVGALRLLDSFGVAVSINVTMAALLLVNAAVLWALSAPLWVYLVAIPVISGSMSGVLILAGFLRVRRAARELGEGGSGTGFDRRSFFRFALGVSAISTLSTMRQRGEVLLIGALIGPAASALFGVAYRVAALIARFGEAGRQSVYPVLGQMVARGEFANAAALAFRFCRLGLLVAVPGLAAMCFFGSEILTLLFGEKFNAAVPNLILLGAGSALYAATFALGPLIQVAIGPGRFLVLNLIAFCGFLPLAILGPLTFGQPGAGAGGAAFGLLLAILATWQVRAHAKSKLKKVG
jgi:O-antigen/teichoic acid export membrane protein